MIEWYHEGQPLANASRRRLTSAFGYVALDILYAFPYDAGTYVCRAYNEMGEATTQCTIGVKSHDTLLLDPQNASSWERVQQLEAPKPAAAEAEAEDVKAPQFTSDMQDLRRFEEQPAHFTTRLADPTSAVSISWSKDGAPLAHANKFLLTSEVMFVFIAETFCKAK